MESGPVPPFPSHATLNKFLNLYDFYNLNVYVPLLPANSNVEILMPSEIVVVGGAFERCLNHEGRAFMNETAVLQRDPSPFPPCEDVVKRHGL